MLSLTRITMLTGQAIFGPLWLNNMFITFRFNILYVASAGVSAGVEFFVSSLRLRFYMKNAWAIMNPIENVKHT